jgi:hypothetical protein
VIALAPILARFLVTAGFAGKVVAIGFFASSRTNSARLPAANPDPEIRLE